MIHIVTCLSRTPDFIDRAYESIKALNINYQWYIVTTADKALSLNYSKYKNTTIIVKPGQMAMHTGVNYYYDVIPDQGQWVYVLDDDNLMHINFNLVEPHTHSPKCDMIVVGQQQENREIRYVDGIFNIAIQKIDNGQFLVRRKAVGPLRYWPIYRGDGYFASEIRILTYESGRDITILPVVASYYNRQTWVE